MIMKPGMSLCSSVVCEWFILAACGQWGPVYLERALGLSQERIAKRCSEVGQRPANFFKNVYSFLFTFLETGRERE